MFYAEVHGQQYCDLWRFNSKKERDSFCHDSTGRNSITLVVAKKKHIDQFNYWKHNKG